MTQEQKHTISEESFESSVSTDNSSPLDYSYVNSYARVALYDDMRSAPRVTTINPSPTDKFIEQLTVCIYEQEKLVGGNIPYTIIREVAENFIHAQFKEIVVSILDNGNTIRFTDQGPGISDKEKAQQPGFTSATQEMTDYIRGVGSGLPIVKDYIDDKQGSITIEDNIKQGAVVTISLQPAHSQQETVVDTPTFTQQLPVQPIKQIVSLSEREHLLLSLLVNQGPLGVTDIVRITNLPQATVYSTFEKLENAGYIEKNQRKKRVITNSGIEALNN